VKQDLLALPLRERASTSSVPTSRSSCSCANGKVGQLASASAWSARTCTASCGPSALDFRQSED